MSAKRTAKTISRLKPKISPAQSATTVLGIFHKKREKPRQNLFNSTAGFFVLFAGLALRSRRCPLRFEVGGVSDQWPLVVTHPNENRWSPQASFSGLVHLLIRVSCYRFIWTKLLSPRMRYIAVINLPTVLPSATPVTKAPKLLRAG